MKLRALWVTCLVAGSAVVQLEIANAAPEGEAARLEGTHWDIAKPGDERQAWTPIQQYLAFRDRQDMAYDAVIVADALGDKLSQAGRLGFISRCFGEDEKDAKAAVIWATCAADVDAFDMKAFKAELVKEGLSEAARADLVKDAEYYLSEVKKYGAAVAEAAKADAGVAAIVAMGKTAQEEWKAFASTDRAELETLGKLEDLASAKKNGVAGDCLSKTKPAIEKAVRATTWHEIDDDRWPATYYVSLLPNTVDAHIAVLAWG